jgi:hypothetical protein
LVAGLVVAGCAGVASPQPTQSPLGTAPVPSPVTATGESSPNASLAPTHAPPTPLSSVVITGNVPGPDATVPPKQAVIPGLSVESLAAQWEALGLMCSSDIGAFPDSPGLFYQLTCQRDDRAGNVTYSATAIYWRTDGVRSLEVSVIELGAGDIADSTAAPDLFLPSAALAGGDPAETWAQARLDDPACGGEPGYCEATVGPVALILAVGVHGARQMDIEAAAYAP